MASSKVYAVNDEEFCRLVATNYSYSDVLRALNLGTKGGSSTDLLKNRIKELGCSTEHFNKHKSNIHNLYNSIHFNRHCSNCCFYTPKNGLLIYLCRNNPIISNYFSYNKNYFKQTKLEKLEIYSFNHPFSTAF